MTNKYRLPTITTLQIDSISSEFKKINDEVKNGKLDGWNLLGALYNAFKRLTEFVGLTKPTFRFTPFKGERSREKYNKARADIANDIQAIKSELSVVSGSTVQCFNQILTIGEELLNRLAMMASDAQDLAIISKPENIDSGLFIFGDGFTDTSLIDTNYPKTWPQMFIDTIAGVATLARVDSKSVFENNSAHIEVALLNPTSKEVSEEDKDIVLYEMYEGLFAATTGNARPEGGKWHIQDMSNVSGTTEDGTQKRTSEEKEVKTKKLKVFEANQFLKPEEVPETETVLVPPLRELGGSESENNIVRQKMIDGNVDTFWECEYALPLSTSLISEGETPTPDLLKERAEINDKVDLEVAVVITLAAPSDVNWVTLNPMNFGETTWFRVKSILTTSGGEDDFTEIPGIADQTFANIMSNDINSELSSDIAGQILSPTRYSYRGIGVWTFPMRKVKAIKFILVQETPVAVPYERLRIQLVRTQEMNTEIIDKKSKGNKLDATFSKVNVFEKIVTLTYMQTIQIYEDEKSVEEVAPITSGYSDGTQYTGKVTKQFMKEMTDGKKKGQPKVIVSESIIDSGWQLSQFWPEVFYDRIAYRIGIKDINLMTSKFAPSSELVYLPFDLPVPAQKVSLEVEQILPSTDSSIFYFISVNGEEEWHEILPLGSPSKYDKSGIAVPKIITFNVPGNPGNEEKYITTNKPVISIRFRVVASSKSDTETPVLHPWRLLIYPSDTFWQDEVA